MKIILFIIYREQVHQFFHMIELMDSMVIYFSIYEHYQSIQSIEIENKSKEKSMMNTKFTLGKSISVFGKTFPPTL